MNPTQQHSTRIAFGARPSRKSLESWISVACGGLTVDSPNLAGPGFAASRPANPETRETSKHSRHFPESFEADFFDSHDKSLIAKFCSVFAQSDNVDLGFHFRLPSKFPPTDTRAHG